MPQSNEELLDTYWRARDEFAKTRKPVFGVPDTTDAYMLAERRYDKARAAVLARMAGPQEVVVPLRPDKGPFEWCGDDGDFIVSRDFTYDAGLKLSGDFPDDETKRAYMQRVMDILNAARPNQGGNDE